LLTAATAMLVPLRAARADDVRDAAREYSAKRYMRAAALYRRALLERPNASWIYRNLASTLSGSGRIDEAKLAFAELLRSYPDLTISKYKQAMVFSGTTLDRMAENLRKLGLPD